MTASRVDDGGAAIAPIEGLDAVIGGRLRVVRKLGDDRESTVVLVRGPAGSGKTIFASQLALREAALRGGDVVYCGLELLPTELAAQLEPFAFGTSDAGSTSRRRPGAETRAAAATATAIETRVAPTPTAIETRVAPTPTATETRAAPTPTATETRAAPTPTAIETRAAPTPTATETRAAPTPTATETRVAPTPTATETRVAPTPTATETRAAPTPTAIEIVMGGDAPRTARTQPRIYASVVEPDLAAEIPRVLAAVKARACCPSVLVVDALADGYGLGPSVSRVIADGLAKLAAEEGLVAILVEETPPGDVADPWPFVADVVFELAQHFAERSLFVTKSRFGPTSRGPHPLVIHTDGGVAIHPRASR